MTVEELIQSTAQSSGKSVEQVKKISELINESYLQHLAKLKAETILAKIRIKRKG